MSDCRLAPVTGTTHRTSLAARPVLLVLDEVECGGGVPVGGRLSGRELTH